MWELQVTAVSTHQLHIIVLHPRKEGLAVLLEVLLVSIEHSIEPWQQFVSAVIRMQDDGHAVDWGDSTNIVSSSDCSSDRCFLIAVLDTFAGEESCSALRSL